MHFGLNMECDYLQGRSEQDAFHDVFAQADIAEAVGLNSVWLAERHFAPCGGGGQPSIASAPIVLATAIAARTRRIRVGTGVYVLPLNHPVRIAEEVATLDYVSQGRFALGVGRSGFPTAYEGYGYDYGESRQRLQECLDILVKAWTQERFSHTGIQKPYVQWHTALVIQMTRHHVPRDEFSLFGFDGGAVRHGGWAARMEAAAAGWIDRGGDFARQNNFLPLDVRMRRQSRREQRLGVGMQRFGEQLLGLGVFYDLAEIHNRYLVCHVPRRRQVVRNE